MRLDAAECRTRASTIKVARVATVQPDGSPHLVPVCFAIDSDVLYSSTDAKPKTTTRLQRLRNVERDPRVTVLVDRYDDDWAVIWWVRIQGLGRLLHSGAERDRAIDLLADRYPQYAADRPDGVVLAVDIQTWKGWSYT